jgi:transposase-like protein
MARRKELSPEEIARKELISDFLKTAAVKDPEGLQSLLKEMMKQVVESSLDGELDEELGYTRYDYRNKDTDNSRNGYSKKTVHTDMGDMDISVPRDRNGEFEPQLVPKRVNTISQDMEAKIISMYAKGMTQADIESHVRDMYGVGISDSTVSRITDKILPIAKEWQNRPLDEIYAVVFMDAIHYHVRSEGQIVKKAVYIAIGIGLDGQRDVLGLWIGENESAKFWLSSSTASGTGEWRTS